MSAAPTPEHTPPEGSAPLRRLHPASLPVNLWSNVRRFLVPGLLVLFFARGERWELWLMLLFVPAALYEVFAYFTTRYGVRGEHLVVQRGLFVRSVRHIPLERIQNLDLVQSVVHRLLRVADVRVETAGGSEPEAVLRVLALDELESFRREVALSDPLGGEAASRGNGSTSSQADATPAQADRELLRLSFAELAKLGFVSNRGLALVAAALGVAYEFGVTRQFAEDLGEQSERLRALTLSEAVTLFLALAVVVVVIVFALSVLWGIVRLWDFRLRMRDDDFRLSCGLLTRFSATIPRRRIQFVSVQQGILQRWLGRVSVRIETAGNAQEEEQKNLSRRWFAPLLPCPAANPLLGEIEPRLRVPPNGWSPLSASGRRRLLKLRLLRALLPITIVGVVFRPWGFAAATLILPLAWWAARREGAFRAHCLEANHFWFRSGAFQRKTSAVPLDRLQSVETIRTPLDRHHGTASLRLDTAGAGPAGHVVFVRYLDRALAERLRQDLGREAARRPRWN